MAIGDVNEAHKFVTSTDQISHLRRGALYEKIWMVAVVLEVDAAGVEDVHFEDVHSRFVNICRTNYGVQQPPAQVDVLRLCRRLGQSRLLFVDNPPHGGGAGGGTAYPMLGLCSGLLADDVRAAFRDDPKASALLEQTLR